MVYSTHPNAQISTLLLYLSSLTISGAVYPTVPHGVFVCWSHTTLERPKSAIFTRPIPPPPTPGINSPSGTFGSSPGIGGGGGTLNGVMGIGVKRRFSGLMSLWRKKKEAVLKKL